MIIVDTSVLIAFFQGHMTAQARRLQRLEVEQTPFAIPMVCCQEVLQGAKNDREWELLHSYLETQVLLTPQNHWSIHVEAARIFYDLRRQGLTIRSTIDCYIAALVLEADGILLHDDRDFEKVKKVRSLLTIQQ